MVRRPQYKYTSLMPMSRLPDSLTRDALAVLIDRFYDAVQRHATLGPIFNARIKDWEEHKNLLVRFWCSVVFGDASYRGSPMSVHRSVPGLKFEHFEQWLELWREVCSRVLEAESAALMHELASRMGGNLSRAVVGSASSSSLRLQGSRHPDDHPSNTAPGLRVEARSR